MTPWSPISTVLQPVILLINHFPHVGLDAKHWEQSTFYCQFQVHRGRTKYSAKTVMKLETGSSTGLHENEVLQGAQHFSPFPGSWLNICPRKCFYAVLIVWKTGHEKTRCTQSLSAASYSGGSSGKTPLLLAWRGGWKGIAEGSIQAWAPQGPFGNTEADHDAWNLVGTGSTDQEDYGW